MTIAELPQNRSHWDLNKYDDRIKELNLELEKLISGHLNGVSILGSEALGETGWVWNMHDVSLLLRYEREHKFGVNKWGEKSVGMDERNSKTYGPQLFSEWM